MNASTIEIGGPPASELIEQGKQRNAKKGVIAKQRKERRAKGADDLHAVDRGQGPTLTQQARRAHKVEEPLPVKAWRRPYALPGFPDPPGYVLCYIARHRNRHGDEKGTLMALREGWVPASLDDIDEEDVPIETLTGRLAKFGDVIGDDSTILMKLPEALKAQRDAYYNNKRDAATKAVTRRRPGLEVQSPAMPLVEDRNEVSVTLDTMRARRAPRKEAEAT